MCETFKFGIIKPMKTYSARKLGEVFAFSRVGKGTLDQGKKGLLKVLDKDRLEEISKAHNDHISKIMEISDKYEVEEEVREKAARTEEKLTSMRDLYLADEDDWENPAELFEWLGFFEGAAYVHWSLVSSKSKEEDVKDLFKLSEGAVEFHKDFLDEIAKMIKEV